MKAIFYRPISTNKALCKYRGCITRFHENRPRHKTFTYFLLYYHVETQYDLLDKSIQKINEPFATNDNQRVYESFKYCKTE